MYTSYSLLNRLKRRNDSVENYVNDGSGYSTLDTIWLVAIGLAALLDIVLMVFGTYYALKCNGLGKIPLWLTVVLVMLMWVPSPLQPFMVVTMTIWGAAGCKE
jgi:hypothetical protein